MPPCKIPSLYRLWQSLTLNVRLCQSFRSLSKSLLVYSRHYCNNISQYGILRTERFTRFHMHVHCWLPTHTHCNTWNSFQRCKCDEWSHILHTNWTPLDIQRCAIFRWSLPLSKYRSQRLLLQAPSSLRPAGWFLQHCNAATIKSDSDCLYRPDGREPCISRMLWRLAQDQACSLGIHRIPAATSSLSLFYVKKNKMKMLQVFFKL